MPRREFTALGRIVRRIHNRRKCRFFNRLRPDDAPCAAKVIEPISPRTAALRDQ
jgi:hypothetical protein